MQRNYFLYFILFFVVSVSKGQTANQQIVLPLIPKPVSLKLTEGKFSLSSKTIIVASDSASRSDAEVFNLQLEKICGFKLPIVPSGKQVNNFGMISIHGTDDKRISKDGYELTIGKKEISIIGKRAGVFYSLQSLIQLISSEPANDFSIPCCEIKDSPRFSWRGMHLDVCRHFFSKEFVEKYIDMIAMYKMNTFHWHLTDDQGWRIEIKKYPKLTEAGAWRNGSMIGAFNDQKYDTIRYGGFYTQDDIREVVAYAAKRHITIVPEIEMPGHSLAALTSYPELSCTGGPFEVAKAWGGFDDVFCPKEETFQFLENVLTEVFALFPGKYIHVGGDECRDARLFLAHPRRPHRIARNADDATILADEIQRLDGFFG